MAQHNESKGADLHEPSNARILNSTGSQLNVGTWVNLAKDENSSGFIPVTDPAGSNERVVGLVEDINIANGNTGVVRVFGRVRFDTSSFSVGAQLRLASSTTYALATDHTHTIGTVITSDANGTFDVDTITLTVAGGTGGATTLDGLNDVSIVGLQDGQVIKSDGGIWRNAEEATTTTVDGTAKQIIANTSGNTVTLSSALGDVVLTNVANKDVLEYNSTTSQFENKALANGLVEDLNDLSDVTITNLQNGQILKNSSGTFTNVNETPQTAIAGTAKQITAVANGNTVTVGSVLGNVNIAGVKNRDVLEYDSANGEFTVRTLPSGIVARLEDLEDVEIVGDEDNKILVARDKSAYFQVNPTSIGDTIYSIDTSGGLMFTKPGGSTPLITSVAVAFATSRSDITNYLIIDETGGDQLMVSIEFAAASITIEQFIDRIVLALQTNWSDGTGTSTERTVNDQMAGSTLVGMNGTWSKAENPNFVRGEKASGTTSDFTINPLTPMNDAQAIRWNISGRPTGYIQGKTAAFTGLGDTPTVIELLDAGVSGLNADSDFRPHYIASRVGNGIRVTALADGSQDNGRLTIEYVDDATGPSNPSGYISHEGDTNLTGGINGVGQEFAFRWTDSAHKHIIARPTLETGGSGTSTFRQGGFAWIDELPTLNLNSDVKLDNPTDGQYAQFDSNADLVNRNFNQSIESLNNVDTTNTTLPTDFQVLGKIGNNYVAADPLISNSKDIVGTPIEGSVLGFDSFDNKWHVQNVPIGSCFAEIGNANIVGGGSNRANFPLSNFKLDNNIFAANASQISLVASGIFKVSAGFSKLINDTAAGSLTVGIDFRVLKNGSVISPSEYRGREDSGFSLFQEITFVENPSDPTGPTIASASRFRDFMIVDGAFGDVFTVDYTYTSIGLIGLNMGDGLLGKSWVRIERIG